MTSRHILFDHLDTHAAQVGFAAPEPLLGYLADVLDTRLTQVELTPEPSWAERYLELYLDPNPGHIQAYADTCLVWVSLVPAAGQRRGISMDYLATLGISSYYAAGDLTGDTRMRQMGNWFYHLQRFLYTALHPDQQLTLFTWPR
jgi:hypothetical protein